MSHACLLAVLFPFLTVLACSDQTSVDLGRNVGDQLSDYAASWDGYAEAFQFESGSDRVQITIDGGGGGTLILGDSPPPAPLDRDNPGAINVGFTSAPVPGFPYPITGARVEAKRLRFEVALVERYRTWCQLQAPACSASGSCACVRNLPASCGPDGVCTQEDAATGETFTLSENKFDLCGLLGPTACVCTPSGCDAGMLGNMEFDAALESNGAQLVGTLVVQGRVTVRLTRQ